MCRLTYDIINECATTGCLERSLFKMIVDVSRSWLMTFVFGACTTGLLWHFDERLDVHGKTRELHDMWINLSP